MDIQFAFANPRRGKRKKSLAKGKKKSTLKAKRPHKKSSGGMKLKRKHKKHHLKKKRNPEQMYATKIKDGKKLKDVSNVFPSKKEVKKEVDKALALGKKYIGILKKRKDSNSLTDKSKFLKQAAKYKKEMAAAQEKALKVADDREAELKTIGIRQSEGWKLKLKKVGVGAAKSSSKRRKKKKSKKLAKGVSAVGEAVAKKRKKRKSKKAHHKKRKSAAKKASAVKHKRRRRRKSKKASVAKKVHKRRKSRKHSKAKGTSARKHHKKSRKHKSRRSKRRRYPKMTTHRHASSTKHYKKGQTFSGVAYGGRRGKKRKQSGRFTFKLNPFGGNMKLDVKKLTGFDSAAEPAALLVGGMLYQKVNSAIQKYVPANIQSMVGGIPFIGSGLLVIAAGIGIKALSEKVPGEGGKYLGLLGEGLIGAAVVGTGVAASQKLPWLSTPLAGVQYTPMSGVQYTPMSGVQYTPMSGGYPPQLGMGNRADFGAADYGGGAGYTEAQNFSNSDFGADDDSGDDDSEIVDNMGRANHIMG
jgi:hypothetical protein